MPTYAAVASAEGPNGLFATLESSRLIIRCAETKLLLRNIDLDPKLVAAVKQLKWFKPSSPENRSERLLLATTENVYVYEVSNQRWTATVKKICGGSDSGGANKIAHIDFGATEDEILAYSALGMKLSMCSLETGASTEIRDPKSPAVRSHSIRPASGHLAIITRPAAKDILTVLAPERKEAEYSIPLPTVDAQGVKWSPDGKWLAVWDTATAGSSLLIYTAMGQLFKRLSGGAGGEDLGYGIQRVEWDKTNRYLAVAANEGKVVLLSTKSFRPAVAFEYPTTVGSSHALIHEEQIANDGSRSYGLAQQPATPPSNPSALGFNHLSIAPNGDLLACVSATMPSTVWIHSIVPNPHLTAVLIHHGNIKTMAWHPHQHGLLLMQCSSTNASADQSQTSSLSGDSVVYIWGYDLPEPLVIPVPTPSGCAAATSKVTWLNSAIKTKVMVSTPSTCSLVSILEADEEEDDTENFPTPRPAAKTTKPRANVGATPASMLGNVDVLETPLTTATGASNFSPIKMDTAQLTRTLGFHFTSLGDADSDDTFDFKRPIRSQG